MHISWLLPRGTRPPTPVALCAVNSHPRALLSQVPLQMICESDWYKQQGSKLKLLDYTSDLLKVRFVPPPS